jgi:hypothetical protein
MFKKKNNNNNCNNKSKKNKNVNQGYKCCVVPTRFSQTAVFITPLIQTHINNLLIIFK